MVREVSASGNIEGLLSRQANQGRLPGRRDLAAEISRTAGAPCGSVEGRGEC